MKKLCLILSIILLLTGCQGFPQLNSGQIIVSPENSTIPIRGTWKIYQYKRISEIQEDEDSIKAAEELLDRIAVFSDTWAMVADESCTDAKYQIRKVKTRDYMLFHHNMDMEDLNISNPMIDIISIISNGSLFFDIAMLDEDTALIYVDNCFYWLKKVSDKIDSYYANGQMNSQNKIEKPEAKDNLLRTGVLIGLRSTVPSTNEEDIFNERASYRTFWISSYNKNIQSSLEAPDLFIPRRSGFWTLTVKTRKYNDFLQDNIVLEPLVPRGAGIINKIDEQLIKGNIKKDILFVSDDYVAIEYSWTMGSVAERNYRVLPLDDANSLSGILVSDIAREDMRDIFYTSAQAHLVSHGIKIDEELKGIVSVSEDNFTLERRNGNWTLKGRLDLGDRYEEFPIGLSPVGKLVNYDELHVPWDSVKERVPMALDAYTSPNKDLLIVVTGNFLMIYTIENGELSEKPIKKIDIKKGESVVMVEWATGDYVARWEKSFNQLNPYIINQ
ncbi:MAG: hypothetical protein GX160_02255 [Clostridiales bacterium]|nr:hypothetical protein [Clostridiales bacterium]